MSIRYRGEISQREFMRGFMAHYLPMRNGMALRIFALAVAIGASVWLGLRSTDPGLLVMGLLVVLSVLAMPWWQPVTLARNAWATGARTRGLEEGAITPQGITHRRPAEGILPWSYFHSYRLFPDMLLLYQAANVFNMVPRSLFASDKDWQAALALVAAHLPERSTTRKPMWGLWVAVVGLVVLGIVLAVVMQGR